MRKRLFCLVWTISAFASTILAQEGFGFDVQVGELYYYVQERGPGVTMEGGPYAMVTYQTYHDENSETEPSYEGLTVVNIPATITVDGVAYPVKQVGRRAFANCSSLISVTIGSKVTRIESEAFYGCGNLTSIVIPNSVTYIGDETFKNCNSLPVIDNIRYADTYLVEVVDKTKSQYKIKDGTVWISSKAFYDCLNLTSITIPESIKYIQYAAFIGCESLASVHINNLAAWCLIQFEMVSNPLIYAHHLYLNGVKLTKLIIPNGIKSIEDWTFAGCSDLTNVEFPNSVISIGNYAFNSCTGLTNLHLPNSVTTIGTAAFSGCSSLTNVTLPESITRIDNSAFWDSHIRIIKVMATTPPSIGSDVFYQDKEGGNTTCFVPMGSLSAYKNTMWDTYLLHVTGMSVQSSGESPTSIAITIGTEEVSQYIISCGVEGSEETSGNVIEWNGLEPESEYADIPLFIKTIAGDYDTIHYSFKTTALKLTTQPSMPVSSTTAILIANTNISDAEVSCGFEWKRNDAPVDMDGTKVFCPAANGQMVGRLTNLKDDVYYKYRAFYQSAAGNMYYGDWQYIFTGDNSVGFEPIIYTYGATGVTENEATLKGYAIASAEDFTEQGFEYWAESRVPYIDNTPARMPAALGEHHTVTATGIIMHVTLTNLDKGTVYKYRTYAKIGGQTVYGSEMSFTTKGEYTGAESVETITITPDERARKILHNGQIFILRGAKVYTTTGQEVK